MRRLRALFVRLADLFTRTRTRRDRDFADELDAHLQLHIDDNVRAGMTPEEARRQALIKLGGVDATKERYRERSGMPLLESLWRDVRFSARLLRRSPGFTLAAIVPVALGIGATTTLFAVVNGVLLRPLPYAEPDRLIRAAERRADDAAGPWERGMLSRGTLEAWQVEGRSIEALAGYDTPLRTLRAGGEPLRLKIGAVSANLFDTLGVSPARGRFFAPGEDAQDGAAVAVLTHALWMGRFGGDPGVLGRPITLDDRTYNVVGVAPPEFYFPDRETELWVPQLGSSAVARLRPGATAEQAAAEATAIATRVRAEEAAREAATGDGHVAPAGPRRVLVIALLEETTRQVRRPLLVLMVSALVVLLVAGANAANLLLVRSLRRSRELVVRAALGGSVGRIARELLVDSLLLGGLAGATGLALAVAGHSVLVAMLPRDFPRVLDIDLDWTVLTFGIAASMLVMVLAGLVPVSLVRRLNLTSAIQASGGSGLSAARRPGLQRLGPVLVVAEVALCCALLVGAGLLTRSFLAMLAVDRGYDASRALSAQVSFSASLPQSRRRVLAADLLERLERTPPVQAAGVVNVLPLEDITVVFSLADGPGAPPQAQAHYRVVSPRYFEAAGMQLLEGRDFTSGDVATGPPVAIVNETFVREYPRGGPRRGMPRNWEIIGVVKDVRDAGPEKPARPTIYRSYLQVQPTFFNRVDLVIRTPDDPPAFVPTLRRLVREVDPSLALYRVETLETQLGEHLARPKLYAATLVAFAGFVLAIIGSGLFGMLAFAVVQRRRELAVRMALGAGRADVTRLVLGQMAITAAIGIVGGLLAAAALSRSLTGLVFGIQTVDPVTFAAAPLVVAVTAVLACVAPLRRALRVHPAAVLRAE
jgi:predicted permease